MSTIPSLRFPDQLPTLKSMCLTGQILIGYDPGIWQIQYESNRYLARLPEAILTRRHHDILFNMTMLTGRERHVIPINSLMSSWYWFRKEHQTRLEFALRGIELPVEVPLDVPFCNMHTGEPVRPMHVDEGDAIFKYGKRIDIEGIVRHGAIRLSPASTLSGNGSHDMAHDACSIPTSGDMSELTASRDYYVFCAASDWDPKLFASFDAADACLKIKNVKEFGRRLESAAATELTGWRFFHGPVHYFDPYERAGFEYIQAGISRHFRFAWQREYRFLWMPPVDQPTRGYLNLTMGDANELMELHVNRDK